MYGDAYHMICLGDRKQGHLPRTSLPADTPHPHPYTITDLTVTSRSPWFLTIDFYWSYLAISVHVFGSVCVCVWLPTVDGTGTGQPAANSIDSRLIPTTCRGWTAWTLAEWLAGKPSLCAGRQNYGGNSFFSWCLMSIELVEKCVNLCLEFVFPGVLYWWELVIVCLWIYAEPGGGGDMVDREENTMQL